MALAKLTLNGFENYMRNNENTSLFSNIVIPEGLNKDTLVDNIMFDLGEFEVLYAQPFFYKSAIEHFFRKYSETFNKWYESMQISYNPLENYDRMESWNDTSRGSSTNNTNTEDTINGTTNDSNRSSTENRVSAFDSNNYQPNEQTDYSDSSTTITNSGSNSTVTNAGSNEGNSTHDGRVHGNIGVTTSQQMLESELNLRKKYNLYKMITDLFAQELCILVYD